MQGIFPQINNKKILICTAKCDSRRGKDACLDNSILLASEILFQDISPLKLRTNIKIG